MAVAMLWLTIITTSAIMNWVCEQYDWEQSCNHSITVHVAIWWTTSTSMVTIHMQICKNKCKYIPAFKILICLTMVWLLFAIYLANVMQICSVHCGGDGMTNHHDTFNTTLQTSDELLAWCDITACDVELYDVIFGYRHAVTVRWP